MCSSSLFVLARSIAWVSAMRAVRARIRASSIAHQRVRAGQRWRGRPAHDLALEAEAGLVSMTLGGDGKPAISGIPRRGRGWRDCRGSHGVLMALLRRQTTGRRRLHRISMHEVTVGGMLNILGPTFAEDRQPIPAHEAHHGGARSTALRDQGATSPRARGARAKIHP